MVRRCSTRCSPPAPGTLVIGADTGTGKRRGRGGGRRRRRPRARAGRPRSLRSLPVRARGSDGEVHDYDDPRLVRERGMRAALTDAGIARKAVAAVGLPAKDAAALCEGDAPRVSTTGASAPLFALAALAERAHERAAARVRAGDDDRGRASTAGPRSRSRGSEPAPQDVPKQRVDAGARDPDLAPGLRAGVRRQGAARGRAVPALRHAGAAAPPPVPGLRRRGRRRARRAAARRDRLHDDHHPHPGARAGHAVHDRDRRARRHRRAAARPGHRRAAGHRRHRRPRRDGPAPRRRAIRASPTTATRSRPPPATEVDADEARGGGRCGHDPLRRALRARHQGPRADGRDRGGRHVSTRGSTAPTSTPRGSASSPPPTASRRASSPTRAACSTCR